MNYLRRLVLRSLSTPPCNMLLPNLNSWAEVIDPFENTLFSPPIFPNVPKQYHSATTRGDNGILISAQSSNTPAILNDRGPGTTLLRSDPDVQATGPPELNKSAASTVQPKMSTKISSPVPLKAKSGTVNNSVTKAETNTGSQDQRILDQTNLVFPQRQIRIQPETRWVRRYRSDINLFDTELKQPPEKKIETSEQPHRLPLQRAQPLLEKSPVLPAKQPPFSMKRRSARKEQPEAPRLVIGRLNVDVVPVKKSKPAYRRLAVVKKRIYNTYGKLTQAEAVRIGFGIGQM